MDQNLRSWKIPCRARQIGASTWLEWRPEDHTWEKVKVTGVQQGTRGGVI